ncbi:MAG: ShlB/FhaC/HecB family hemolysin secretion/activation protein [Phycisphaeraceae bacterium]|nr:ShlB/FhaC/HecB family hemolysin secretion/activation protein [Phycisphaeraceae bacterium]
MINGCAPILFTLALGLGIADAKAQSPRDLASAPVTAALANHQAVGTLIRSVRVDGLDAWGVEQADPTTIRVRYSRNADGVFTAAPDRDETNPVRTLGELLRASRDDQGQAGGILLDGSAIDEITTGVRGWMLRTLGKDYGEQRTPTADLDGDTLVLRIEAPGPGVGEDGPHTITGVRIEGLSQLGLSDSALLASIIELTPVSGGMIARRAGLPVEAVALGDLGAGGQPARLYGSALRQAGASIVRAYNSTGLRGVRVAGRLDGQTLVLSVTEGVVGEVRTLGFEEERAVEIATGLTERIKRRSPVQPGQLVDIDAIDEFVHRLNRHPGRRVDVALAPGEQTDRLVLDYLVAQNDPLFVFGQLSNTGTDSTGDWRERFGVVHYNLTDNDDIFTADYTTANFSDYHAVTVSYDRPFDNSAPDDSLRWRAFLQYVRYTASDVGFAGRDFTGDTFGAGAEVSWNFWQRRAKFADLVGGLRFTTTQVDDNFFSTTASSPFLLPYVGLRYEERTDRSSSNAAMTLETSIGSVPDTNDLDALGRSSVDDGFTILRFDASHSFFLEPLLDRSFGAEGSTLAHELFFSIRGQTTFSSRVPPNFVTSAGGFYSVRGYPESFVIGDHGYVATAEYRYHVPRGLTPGPVGTWGDRPFRWRPQQTLGRPDWDLILRGFLDVGRTVNEQSLPFESNATLVGAGVGAELAIRRNFSLRLDWGFVLNEASNDVTTEKSGDNRLHAQITVLY